MAWSINAAISLVCTSRFNIKVNDNALLKTREVSCIATFAAVKLICAVRDEYIVAKAANQRICTKATDEGVIAISAVKNVVTIIACQVFLRRTQMFKPAER